MKAIPHMIPQQDLDRIRLVEFVEQFRGEVVKLSDHFGYFSAGLPLGEEEMREYLEDPAAALPPSVVERLPKLIVVLVPFLEHSETKPRRSNGVANGHAAPE